MNDEFDRGREAGLLEAVDILRRLEEAVAVRLQRPAHIRTRDARRVRHKAFAVAAARVSTCARKAGQKAGRRTKIQTSLEKLGL